MRKKISEHGSRIFQYTASFIRKHRYLTVGALILILGVGYGVYAALWSSTDAPTYTLAAVERGTLVSSVTASGQVAALDEIELKAKASGDVVWVGVKAGDRVRAGQALASLDAREKQQAILDAEQSLREAELQYQKDAAEAPIDFSTAEEDIADAKADLVAAYADVYTALSDAYLEFPAVMADTEDALYDYDLTSSQWNIDVYRSSFTDDRDVTTITALVDAAARDYKSARADYDATLVTFKTLSRSSEPEKLAAFLAKAIPAATQVAQAVESAVNLVDTYVDLAKAYNRTIPTVVTQTQAQLRTDLSSANAELTSLLAAKRSLDTGERAVRDAERAFEIMAIGNPTGKDPISLQAARYSIEDHKRTVAELKADMSDYTVTAPFSGVLASFDLKRFDSVSVGVSAGVLIADERVATLSLNEVDVARISMGDRAELTFDAVEDLTVPGTVVEISPKGTVSQGVVSYEVKLVFAVPDEQVKPGMTVNATIVVEEKNDVLVVPQSAVKSERGQSYVEVFDASVGVVGRVTTSATPTRVNVETGLEGDADVEVLSGLEEGQVIIVRTNSGATEASSGQSFGSPPIRL